MNATALYDFHGNAAADELSFRAGERLVVLRAETDGDGWWEGRNASGEEGILPALYVQLDNTNATNTNTANNNCNKNNSNNSNNNNNKDVFGGGDLASELAMRLRSVSLDATQPPEKQSSSETQQPTQDPTEKQSSQLNQQSTETSNKNPSEKQQSVVKAAKNDSTDAISLPMLTFSSNPLVSIATGTTSTTVSSSAVPSLAPTSGSSAELFAATRKSSSSSATSINAAVQRLTEETISNTVPVRRMTTASVYSHNNNMNNMNNNMNATAMYNGNVRPSSWLHEDSDDDDASVATGVTAATGRTTMTGSTMLSMRATGAMAKYPSVRKSFNRFSPFVNSGAEAFIVSRGDIGIHHAAATGATNTTAIQPPQARIDCVGGSGAPVWRPTLPELGHRLSVVGWERGSKFAGAKNFIAYRIHDQETGLEVFRRYKHFDWLHRILADKFATLCLPPLPEKHQQGRMNEEFVERRQRALERYLRRLARHPAIRESDVFQLFISCSDQKHWKAGKRRAEKDIVKRGRFLHAVDVARPIEDQDKNTFEVAAFQRFIKNMSVNVTGLMDASGGMISAAPTFHNMYMRMSFTLKRLIKGNPRDKQNHTVNADGSWCWRAHCNECDHLSDAMDYTANTLRDISTYWEVNASRTCLPFVEGLREYTGLIDSMATAAELHQKTSARLRDARKSSTDPEGFAIFKHRCDTVSNVSMAEVNRFHDERVDDFKKMVREFLEGQMEFHDRMLVKLSEAKRAFE